MVRSLGFPEPGRPELIAASPAAGQADCRPPPTLLWKVVLPEPRASPNSDAWLPEAASLHSRVSTGPVPASSEVYLSGNIDDTSSSLTTPKNPLLSLQASHIPDTRAACPWGAGGSATWPHPATVSRLLMASRERSHVS